MESTLDQAHPWLTKRQRLTLSDWIRLKMYGEGKDIPDIEQAVHQARKDWTHMDAEELRDVLSCAQEWVV